ncbi:MAG: hypothetical protein EPO26_07795 [Chloroflexota bacterium]|nr:MAG: hypothetical protein EPO26_07795 [Chloroflexota bacterium]
MGHMAQGLLLLAVVLSLRPSVHAQTAWQDLTVETGAGAIAGRQQFGLAAAPDGTIYLYGGLRNGTALDDLWSLPAEGRWRQLQPAPADAPPPLVEPHLTVDRAGRLYEYGGIRQDGRHIGDLYRFDPTSERWARIPGAGPPARQDHGFVADPAGDALYVFGGEGADGNRRNDFWRYDIARAEWVDLTEPSGAWAIQPRELYNLTLDGHGHLYLFGGTIDGGDSYPRRLNDFWRYDITSGLWESLTTASGSATVPGRHYYGQVADADGAFYVLGGFIPSESTDQLSEVAGDLWIYDPARGVWVNGTSLAAPVLPRVPYALVWDPRNRAIALFGGARPDSSGTLAPVADYWRWSPTGWSQTGPRSRIDESGGDVRSADSALVLALPVGALNGEHAVSIGWTGPPTIDGASTRAGVEIRVDGAADGHFARNTDLMIRVDQIPNGPILREPVELRRQDLPNRWVSVPGRLRSDGHTFGARISDAGSYAVIVPPHFTTLLPMLPHTRMAAGSG